MRRLVPDPAEEDLPEVYRDLILPDAAPGGRAWVALGMISSVDGAATVAGRTDRLGGPADHHAFRALRGACDAILVGAGTVRIEGYGPGTGTEVRREARLAKGLAAVPRLVVVSASLDLDPAAKVFSAPQHPPLVVSTAASIAERGGNLDGVAELLACGDHHLDLVELLQQLPAHGLRRVLCEGGPTLNAHLLRDDLIDEVFLTLTPALVGGAAPRIVGPGEDEQAPRPFVLDELREHEGELLLRYRHRDR